MKVFVLLFGLVSCAFSLSATYTAFRFRENTNCAGPDYAMVTVRQNYALNNGRCSVNGRKSQYLDADTPTNVPSDLTAYYQYENTDCSSLYTSIYAAKDNVCSTFSADPFFRTGLGSILVDCASKTVKLYGNTPCPGGTPYFTKTFTQVGVCENGAKLVCGTSTTTTKNASPKSLAPNMIGLSLLGLFGWVFI